MKWNIVADSSCDIFDTETPNSETSFSTVPFIVTIDGKDYVDDENLNVDDMVDAMINSKTASHTTCPAPGVWYEKFKNADCSIAVTISGNLSGSYNSAMTARSMVLEEHPEKKIAVIDSISAGPSLILIIEEACRLIAAEGHNFAAVIDKLEKFVQRTRVVFALSSFDNLVKNGRMSKFAGLIAGKLGFWGIGIGSEIGTIVIKDKVRGQKKALKVLVEDIVERGEDMKSIIISHCQNREFAETVKGAIQSALSDIEVRIVSTRGLCSYYAEKGGLIIGF